MATSQQATKTALVTGAFSGIGLATALRLAQDGWNVYAAGRNVSKNGELMKQAQALGVQIKSIAMDVTDEGSIETAIDQIAHESGRLDLLVNNAGSGFTGAVTDSSNRQMRQLFEINVIGVVAVTRLALPLMLRHQQGRVINISSALGKAAFPGLGIYAATKFAMEGLSDAMRLEFKILGPDFHVILIEPGFIKTHFGDNVNNAEPATQATPYGASYATLAANNVQAGIDNAPGPKIVADVIAKAARERNPKSRYGVTNTAKMLMFLRRLLPNRLFDSMIFSISGLRKYAATQRATTKLSAAKLTIS
jgi:NAD(P)-dependent dehydrogenase (short-subunit alcohol dehydrogenase family)